MAQTRFRRSHQVTTESSWVGIPQSSWTHVFLNFLSQGENLKLAWLPYLVLLRKFELFLPCWLESRVYGNAKGIASFSDHDA